MTEAVSQVKIGAALDGTFDTTIQTGKRKMGELGAAAREAGKGTGSIGDGMAGSATKVEAATKNMVGSIQRQIAALEAGDKSSRQYQESLARMRGIDTAALKPYLDQLDQVKAKQKSAADSVAEFSNSFSGLKTAVLAATAVIGGMALFVKKINDGVDALNDMKDATGASIENISALEDVALRTGVSMDAVSTGMVKFNKLISDAKPGSEAEKGLKAIGLSVKELKDLDPAEAMRRYAVAMSGFADDGNKARLMLDQTGKSVKEMAAFYKDLAEQGSLVAKVTTQQAEEAERFNKSLFEMQKNVTDISRDLAGPMVSAINEVIAKFKEGRAAGEGFFQTGWKNYMGNVRNFWGVKENTGGTTGSWDSGATGEWDAPKPSVNVPVKADPSIAAAARKAAADAKREIEDQIKLLAELSGFTGDYEKTVQRITEMRKSGLMTEQAYVRAITELVNKQPGIAAGLKAEEEAAKAMTKARTDAIQSHAKEIESINDKAQKIEDEVAMYGMSKEAIESLTTARELDRIEVLKGFDNSGEEIKRMEESIAARKRLVAAGSAMDVKDVNSKAAKDMAAEQKKAAEESEKWWEDSLMRAFESGKGFFQSLWDTIKNTLKTQVLKIAIQGTMGTLGLGASGMASAAGSSTFGGAASSMIGSSISSLIPASFSTFGNAALAGVQSMVGMTGTVAQAATAAANGIAYGTTGAASTAAGLGSQLAVAAPYLGAALLAYMVINGNKTKSAADSGGARIDYSATGSAGSAYLPNGGTLMTTAAVNTVETLGKAYFDTAKSLGIKAIQATFEFGSNTGHQGENPNFAIGVNAGKAGYSSGETATSDAAISLAASRAVLTALQASELPTYLAGVFDNITASTATQDQITASLAGAQALKGFNDVLKLMPAHFEQLATLSYKATQGLIGFSGGLDALSTNLGTYYSNFYSAEDQRLQTIKNINAATAGSGLDAATATRDSFRTIVEAQDLTTESGQKMYAALLGVAGAFAGITPAAEDASVAIAKAADAAKKAAEDAQKAARDLAGTAFTNLQKAIDAEKARVQLTIDLAQEQVTSIGSIFDTLKSNVNDLYASVGNTSAVNGSAFIDQALSNAQSTGYLPDSTQLADAITAARGGVDSAIYASQQDADFARLELAGRLDQLKTISGDQLTGADKALKVAQGQLDALDLMAANAQLQLDALDGISGMILSIGEAMGAFEKAVGAAGVAGATATHGSNDGTSFGGGGSAVTGPQSAYSQKTYGPAGIIDSYITDATAVSRLDTLKGIVNSVGVATPQDVASLAAFAQSWGYTMQDVANATGYLVDDWGKVFGAAGVPAFASGGYHSGGLALVGEQGPELVNFSQPSQIYTAGQTQSLMGGNTARLEALIVELTAKVAALEAPTTRTANAIEGNQSRPLLVELA